MALTAVFEKIENFPMVQAVRSALVMSIPILLPGSFALILRSLPVAAYQRFLENFYGGALIDVFQLIHAATFGILSIFITTAVSSVYARMKSEDAATLYGAPVTSLVSFAILSGVFSGQLSMEAFGVKGMFTALFCSSTVTPAFIALMKSFGMRRRIYSDGADYRFNLAISVLPAITIIVSAVSIINYLLIRNLGLSGFHELFIYLSGRIFVGGATLGNALLFVFLSSLMWFFGIHGSNVLEAASLLIFSPGLDINQSLAAAGLTPNIIFTRSFFDIFVLIGGCGGSLSLLIAIFLFSKRSGSRNLARLSLFPMLFNINEIMVFGFPVVLNPILFIPFILVPLLLALISYLAFYFNLAPVTLYSTEWTTPALLGGYAATGSLRGAALQLVNIIVGVAVYRPFVIFYDKEMSKKTQENMRKLVDYHKEHEEKCAGFMLTSLGGAVGAMAKELTEDLQVIIENGGLSLFYQPQFDSGGKCVGAEALLRWNHRSFGFIYPPLVIKLAEEKGFLAELEESVILRASRELPELRRALGGDIPVSVNVTGSTISTDRFEQFLRHGVAEGKIDAGGINIEVTEQFAIETGLKTEDRLRRIRELGFNMEIDDFSMGHTSIKYLQSGIFGTVKLDGGIVKDITRDARSREIIASIVGLSHSLGFRVIAEYVETEEIRAALEAVGCHIYQGYLFSPALPLAKLHEALKDAAAGRV
ncbi:MAG: EAL domain-containing protein [Synergistaceae bacterium]|nr:EAL domain-containing protein [Synergistaceae bacterium]